MLVEIIHRWEKRLTYNQSTWCITNIILDGQEFFFCWTCIWIKVYNCPVARIPISPKVSKTHRDHLNWSRTTCRFIVLKLNQTYQYSLNSPTCSLESSCTMFEVFWPWTNRSISFPTFKSSFITSRRCDITTLRHHEYEHCLPRLLHLIRFNLR